MSLLEKLMNTKVKVPEETLEQRLEAIFAKASENDTGLATEFIPDNEPKVEGYDVEYIEGDVEQVTAEWMLAKTEWKLENGRPVEEPGVLSIEPRNSEKLSDKWKDVRRED